jgi:hypothetical protein
VRVRALSLASSLARSQRSRSPRPSGTRPSSPPEQRGAHRRRALGHARRREHPHVFWNFGMVGDFPSDPGNVDLSVFHSVEVPKGSGMNYSDGITPFVLAKVPTSGGAVTTYIMETGFRERQAISPYTNQVMRFEPRPAGSSPTDDQPRPLARDQQRPAHLARLVARQDRPIRTIRAGGEAGTATSASARRPTRKASP